jgi:hypothetical protein
LLVSTSTGAIIDLSGPVLSEIFAPEQDDAAIGLAASDPSDGAVVAIPRHIMLRFLRPARVETLTDAMVTLAGPDGDVPTRIVPAEYGRLAFITPTTALQPNTTYLVNGARDAGDAPLPFLSVTFTTDETGPAGASPSSDAEVWDPRTSDGWSRTHPVSRWQQLPPLRAPAGVTAVSGQVLRLDGSPLPGVTLIEGKPAVTDRTGNNGDRSTFATIESIRTAVVMMPDWPPILMSAALEILRSIGHRSDARTAT